MKTKHTRVSGVKVFYRNDEQWFDLSQARIVGGHRYIEYERLRHIAEIEAAMQVPDEDS